MTHELKLRYIPVAQWPPLAWLAACRPGTATVEVFHGARVETAPQWFGEIVWAGDYVGAAFDTTDVVFGSGGRLRGNALTFVASATTVDRLHSIESDGVVWVSNSLGNVLAAAGAAPDAAHSRYFADFKSITRGLGRYCTTVPTTRGPVRLTYFHNLVWTGLTLREQDKPRPRRDFSTFEAYRTALDEALHRLAVNLADPLRSAPLRFLGSLSSGYDSSTVAALARPHLMRQAVSFDAANTGEPDGGSAVARALDIELLNVPSAAWRSRAFSEVPFLAADAKGEDVYFAGAEESLAGCVLLTGFHGDRVWSCAARRTMSDLARGDQSGLSLSEYRLWAGFIHCPVPFIGARQLADIQAISASREMAPWDSGSAYSRPICRRIVEGAGVPRTAFGARKRAASVLFFARSTALSPSAAADYGRWLAARANGHRTGVPVVEPRFSWMAVADTVARPLRLAARVAPRPFAFASRLADRVSGLGQRDARFRQLFHWALSRVTERYAGANGAP